MNIPYDAKTLNDAPLHLAFHITRVNSRAGILSGGISQYGDATSLRIDF